MVSLATTKQFKICKHSSFHCNADDRFKISHVSLSGDELRVVHFNSLVGVTIIPNSLVGYQLFAIRWWGFLRISTFRIWGLKVGSWHIISSVRNNFGHF